MTAIYVDSTYELDVKLHDEIRSILEQKALEIEGVAKRLVASGGGGREYDGAFIYRKWGKLYSVPARKNGTTHRVGLPGGPPASDTGDLLGSIDHAMGEDGEGQYSHIGSNLFYAYWVEVGNKLIHPHPYLRPALFAVTGNAGFEALST